MLKVNKKIEYALMALKFIAEKQIHGDLSLTSAREVCDKFNTPFDTTAKVMQKMNAHNILSSHKGIKGGYSLSIELSEITYMQLARIIEGERSENICETAKGLCECYETCNIKTPIDNLNRELNQYLDSLSLDKLLITKNITFNPDRSLSRVKES